MLYLGTPYSKIADEWLGRKQPEPGTRHLTSLKLAIDLRYVCDNNPKLIKQILMEQPFVKQMIEERGENIDQTIESAMGYKMHTSMSKRMAEAVGNKITYLERVTFAGIALDTSLERGEWRYLNEDEMALIKPYLS